MKSTIVKIPAILCLLFLYSCKKEICIKCKPIVEGNGKEEKFCSKEKNERESFMVKWIKEGYNCFKE